jgi:hypothetical protein
MSVRKTEQNGVFVGVGDSVKYKKTPRSRAVAATVLDVQDVLLGILHLDVKGETIKSVGSDQWVPA